jgi:K+/H+ antiporter YhaU regulatory subunit KhtT
MRIDSDEIIYNPPAGTMLNEGSIIAVLGEADNIQKAKEFARGG